MVEVVVMPLSEGTCLGFATNPELRQVEECLTWTVLFFVGSSVLHHSCGSFGGGSVRAVLDSPVLCRASVSLRSDWD